MAWWLRPRPIPSLSTTGLLLGTLFLAASVTPSLLPRTALVQGIVSGTSLAAGYGIGVALGWLWRYLELPGLPARLERPLQAAVLLFCAAVAALFLWLASGWQDSIRALMDLEPVEEAQPLYVALVALAVLAAAIILARLFHWTFHLVSVRLKRLVPHRVSHVLGFAVAALLFWSLANGVIFRAGLRLADSSYQQLDALIESAIDRPSDPDRTGSKESLLSWEELGRTGRDFVASGPAATEISEFLGREAQQPIRVYVGLNAAPSVEERARLALDELLRVNAFDRSLLVVVTPTGTGWIDPAAIDTLEYLHRGDMASVAVQYSYLASSLSLMVEADYGVETARAVFKTIYEHWTGLPENERPRLYLHGLSLGALNSDRSVDLFDVIGDPFHGALWSGPPFPSDTWRAATRGRAPGSTAWLPRFRDGSVIRFANQSGPPDIPGAAWGPLRIVYLQYASDPITFFEPEILYRRPEWLDEPRGPDVSPELRWFPVVTSLQLIADMLTANAAPVGYGHVYAPAHYINAWLEVTAPDGWTNADVTRLKAHFAQP